MVKRLIQQPIELHLFKGKVILLLGARQVGKTTLLKQLEKDAGETALWLNADESDIRTILNTATTSTALLQLFGSSKLVIIDEAQRVEEIGLKLKLIVDAFPGIQVIASGSSSFDLLQKSNESLTGRKREYYLHPLSYAELVNNTSVIIEKRLLETRLMYGSYPEVINNPGNEREVLKEIMNSYLFKDLLLFEGINKSWLINKLLQALALQIGNEVSYNELANTIGNVNSATIERYIDLLEKAFVVFRLPALSRNLRNEIKKGKKIYFYDTGIRNAILNNFNPMSLRNDKGSLWENYLLAERLKRNAYNKHYCNSYFWRTFDKAEVDYIEEYNGSLFTYEFKWKTNRQNVPASLLKAYSVEQSAYIDTDNYHDFLI